MLRQIAARNLVEALASNHCAKSGEIFAEGIENAKPVLAIVDLQPLETGETAIGLDELFSLFRIRAPLRIASRHAITIGNGLHHGGSHASLQIE